MARANRSRHPDPGAGDRTRRFDKGGEQFYDQISALHKSVRSSNPDAALYWLTRMLDGGADPAYLARRMTRMAWEDIGLADPRALQMAIEAWDDLRPAGLTGRRTGTGAAHDLSGRCRQVECRLRAFNAAAPMCGNGTQDVPLHLRNAPTKLMKSLGYGKDYQYDHDAEGGIALDQTGFPDAMGERVYYAPTPRGMEGKLKEKLDALRAARQQARDAKGSR
jgi:putative ATPase